MKQSRPHQNVSKVKVTLPGAPKGTGHLVELRRDGLQITFLPGKGNHKQSFPPRQIGFERLIGLQTRAPDPFTYGSTAEECQAALSDLEYVLAELRAGRTDAVEFAAVREQLRRAEKVLSQLKIKN